MPERHDGTRHFAVERFYSLHRHCGKWWRGGEPAVNRRAGFPPAPRSHGEGLRIGSRPWPAWC